jgi:hypothetical protein
VTSSHDVFISYSRNDKPVADAACTVLERNGVRCWIPPRDVAPGTRYAESVMDAIARSRIVVLVLSENADKSERVEREIRRAARDGVGVIPILIDNEGGRLEFFMGTALAKIDARTPPIEPHMERLVEAVRKVLGPPPDVLGPPPGSQFAAPPAIEEFNRRYQLLEFDERVHSRESLSPTQQRALLNELGWALSDEKDPVRRDYISQLLRDLRNRHDAMFTTAREVDALLAEAVEAPRGEAQRSAAQPQREPLAAVSPTLAAVFLSYSTADDDDVAAQIVDALSDRGISCFYAPRDLGAGSDYQRVIPKAILGCTVLIALLSPAALRSPHVQREVSLALDFRKEILPFSLKGLRPQDIATDEDWMYLVTRKQVAKYVNPAHIADAVSRLASE